MTSATWRYIAFALALICGYQRWQSCTRAAPAGSVDPAARAARCEIVAPTPRAAALTTRDEPRAGTIHGFKVPAWAMRLAPQRGETLRDYRDRMLPLVEVAIAPQRARVARLRDGLTSLGSRERAALDAAVTDTATAIENRVMQAIASGELQPASFTPMTGVALTRDLLELVDRGNTSFLDGLTPEQRADLTAHRFDFADYLVFTARWEDVLRVLD